MNETIHRDSSDKTQSPQNQQYYGYGPQHMILLSVCFGIVANRCVPASAGSDPLK
jgi:hypothetical protein